MRTAVIGAVSLAILSSQPVLADTVRLAVGQKLPRFSLLTPSTYRYVRYLVKSDGARQLIDIWSRRLTIETASGGHPAMRIYQRWDRADGSRVLIQDSWFEPGTFKPLTHVRRRTEQGGKTTLWGFRFADKAIVGMSDLPGNERSDFSMQQDEGHYNFELDMELLQTLQLEPGRQYVIPFYDAGIENKPDLYTFAVAGSARLAAPDGRIVDCWLVTADYNSGKVVSRFWFSKRRQVLIREEQRQDDGSLLVKALLPPESQDERPVIPVL